MWNGVSTGAGYDKPLGVFVHGVVFASVRETLCRFVYNVKPVFMAGQLHVRPPFCHGFRQLVLRRVTYRQVQIRAFLGGEYFLTFPRYVTLFPFRQGYRQLVLRRDPYHPWGGWDTCNAGMDRRVFGFVQHSLLPVLHMSDVHNDCFHVHHFSCLHMYASVDIRASLHMYI